MASTGISCFAYPRLVAALGLPPRLPRVYDTFQMLALPDADVLDALDCDCVSLGIDGITNAYPQPERWRPYDFAGRLPALVENPERFTLQPDGTIHQDGAGTMVPGAFVFDWPHGGEPIDLDAEPSRRDLTALRSELAEAGTRTRT